MTVDARRRPLSDQAADEIRALLGRRRISQAELARRLEVNSSWLNYRLTGRQPIDLNDLQLIADALDVSPATLLGLPYGAPNTLRNQAAPQKARSRRPLTARKDTRPPNTRKDTRRPSLLRHAAA